MQLQTGQKAPEITLPDQNGQVHHLSDYLGKWVLVYFYPEDDTSGCTKEACAIRDNFPSFGNINAVVLGISVDSVESHKKFEEKYSLPFTLLADADKKSSKDYDVLNDSGRDKRISFLIDPQGNIAKVYEKVIPENHAAEVLQDLATMEAK